ncbi:glycine cleavage system protein R [Desulfosediminicola flagellatus]|uniref:glycine cleavage system protein R n=1 Tax=Desulfosediminicola flagellatus TaxID=2569541 RepID=UPI00142F2170|nr:ACT domain-containing protein [Desulfosediminicola flagellatus]
MNKRYIMTAFGVDRVGIVADVTRLLYENSCNLEDTTMNLLVDEFTLSMLFSSADEDVIDNLSRDCRRLEMEKGISAFIRPLSDRNGEVAPKYNKCTLQIEGLDQAGIVYKTSQFLTDNKLNILNLNSTSKPSPQSGSTIYNMDIEVEMPAGLSIAQLEEDLVTVADDLQLDIHLTNQGH